MKDKGDISSMSFPRGRLGKIWYGAGTMALKSQG